MHLFLINKKLKVWRANFYSHDFLFSVFFYLVKLPISLKVYYGKKNKIFLFSTKENLVEMVESEWESLKQFNYNILLNPDENVVVENPFFNDIEELVVLLREKKPVKLVIRTFEKEFSHFKGETEVLHYINAVMNSSTFFSSTTNDADFPVISSDVVSDAVLTAAAEYVKKELEIRLSVIDVNHLSLIEYSMKEFISPILISSVKLMIDRLKQENCKEKVSLSCEKKIIGNCYFGSVDYSMVFDCFDIVVTEAKRGYTEWMEDILRNIVQQRSAKEFLSKAIMDPSLTGENRKRKYEENFSVMVPLPSYGIVSNGMDWIFIKTIYNCSSKKTVVVHSASYNILPKISLEDIKQLISRIVGILELQLKETKSNNTYQKFKRNKAINTAGTLNREVTLAKETLCEMESIEMENHNETDEGTENDSAYGDGEDEDENDGYDS
jgi:hypothetical protein